MYMYNVICNVCMNVVERSSKYDHSEVQTWCTQNLERRLGCIFTTIQYRHINLNISQRTRIHNFRSTCLHPKSCFLVEYLFSRFSSQFPDFFRLNTATITLYCMQFATYRYLCNVYLRVIVKILIMIKKICYNAKKIWMKINLLC